MSYPLDPKVALTQIEAVSSSSGVAFAPIQNGLMMLAVQLSVWKQWLRLHHYDNGDFREADGRPRTGYAETLEYASKAAYESAYDDVETGVGDALVAVKAVLALCH